VGLLAPTEFGAAAHARSGGDGERARLDVAIDDARREQLDLLRAVDVALDLTRDRDRLGPDAPRQLGTLLDREVALDVDVALELAGDADVTRTDDLTGDRDVGAASGDGLSRHQGRRRVQQPDGGRDAGRDHARYVDGRDGVVPEHVG